MAAGRQDPMEVPTGDDEDSPCIGATTDPPERTFVQTDADSGPDADQVYGARWT